jgi:radical SAM protein with 4Fe4S-binding SPASM domain
MTGQPDTHEAYLPRMIAWEVTRACPLACRHCRAAAMAKAPPGELTTDEGRRLLDNIASFSRPTIILTGGEPMLRDDIYDLAAHARDVGLPVVMAPCGIYLNGETVGRLKKAGVSCISVSIDGATAASHDAFRGVPGAFEMTLRGVEAALRGGLPFQINTTVCRHNLRELPAILELAIRLGAVAFNPFMLVPTGRGKAMADEEIAPAEYEKTLEWLAGLQDRTGIRLRVTCAPHYTRILSERRKMSGCDAVAIRVVPPHEHPAMSTGGRGAPATPDAQVSAASQPHMPPGAAPAAGMPAVASPASAKGCLGGKTFAFISHVGKVQICGFLDLTCGDLREEDFNFRHIWESSPLFLKLRQPSSLSGKCGICEYRRICGGCRARAFAFSDDALAEEPFCIYQPHGK